MKNIKYIFWFFKKYKKQYILAIFALLLLYFITPIPSRMIGQFIDIIRQNQLTQDNLIKFVLTMLFVLLIRYILDYLWAYYLFGYSSRSARDNRRRFVQKLLKQSPKFYSKNSSGSLMTKASQDIMSIEILTGFGIMGLMEAIVYPLIIVCLMGFTISWPMTLTSISLLPIIIFASRKLIQKISKIYTNILESYDKLNESVMENITSIRVIKGFSTQKVSQERFNEKADNLYENQMELIKVDALFIPLTSLIPALTFIIALLFGEYLIGNNTLTLGQLTTFFFYLSTLVSPMITFGDLINTYQEASTALGRLEEIYTYKEDIKDKENAKNYEMKSEIAFDNISFKYNKTGKMVLKNINFTINKGDTIGIVGKIGSGKTSLIKLLLRYYNIDEGEIYLDNKPISDYKIASIREKIAYVPQQYLLFSKSVYENIEFGRKNATKEEIDKSIEFSDFKKDLHTLPNGLETMIGEKGISISGGQKQRVSISRAIIKDPEILILDDSLSAVDTITEKNILENIKKERSGKTTIIIAHRLSGVKHADNIIVLDDGEIKESGNHEELLNNRAWYYEQYESQKSKGGLDGR